MGLICSAVLIGELGARVEIRPSFLFELRSLVGELDGISEHFLLVNEFQMQFSTKHF